MDDQNHPQTVFFCWVYRTSEINLCVFTGLRQPRAFVQKTTSSLPSVTACILGNPNSNFHLKVSEHLQPVKFWSG